MAQVIAFVTCITLPCLIRMINSLIIPIFPLFYIPKQNYNTFSQWRPRNINDYAKNIIRNILVLGYKIDHSDKISKKHFKDFWMLHSIFSVFLKTGGICTCMEMWWIVSNVFYGY